MLENFPPLANNFSNGPSLRTLLYQGRRQKGNGSGRRKEGGEKVLHPSLTLTTLYTVNHNLVPRAFPLKKPWGRGWVNQKDLFQP